MQAELFEVTGPAVKVAETRRTPASWLDQFSVTLRLDHLLIAGILALVLYVLTFSFGVEKGKRYAFQEREAGEARQTEVASQLTREKTSAEVEAPTHAPAVETTAPEPAALPLAETAPFLNPLTGEYTIQLITFNNRVRAQKEVARLKKLGYHGFVLPRGRFFQVCADAFVSVRDAQQKLAKLRAEGFAPPDAYVRPLNGFIPV